MKHTMILLLATVLSTGVFAQGLKNNGAHIVLTNNSHLVVDGNYVNQNDGRLHMDGDVWLSGNIENNATVNAVAGADASNTLHLNGDATQTFSGTFADVLTLENLSIENGALAELAADQQLTLKGDFTGNGTFTLLSDATGTASFIVEGAVTGDATAQMYLSETASGDPHWHYVTLPIDVSGGNIEASVFGTPYSHSGDYYAAYWDETILDYSSITSGTTFLSTNMRGYAVPKPAAETIDFTGTLLNGDQQANFTRQTTGTSAGYNLAGNPYTSGIDLKTISTAGSVSSNIESTVWIRNDQEFITYNWTTGVSTDPGFTGVVPAMQGMWFRVTEGQNTGSVQLSAADRTHSNTGVYKKSGEHILRLQIAGNDRTDRAVIGFYDEAVDALDAYDSEKIFATDEDKPQLYSFVNNRKLAINGLENNDKDQRSMPLYISTPEMGLYEITADNIADFSTYEKVMLEDRLNGTFTNLREQDTYAFTADTKTTDHRFNIHFGTPDAIGVEEVSSAMQIYANNKQLYIRTNNGIDGDITLIDATGKTRMQKDVYTGAGLYQTPVNLQSGVYILKVTNGKHVQTDKIIIK